MCRKGSRTPGSSPGKSLNTWIRGDLVFCVDQQGYEEYGFFMHEADILLWALGGAAERGELTLNQLR